MRQRDPATCAAIGFTSLRKGSTLGAATSASVAAVISLGAVMDKTALEIANLQDIMCN